MKSEKGRTASLFFTFLKIGAFTFGGGYAMIPLIQREVTQKKQWISVQDVLDVVAIAESTPGPIAINSATFVGYKVAGFPGALAATLGVVLPSFLIIMGLSFVLQKFEHIPAVQYGFLGIRAGVLALILRALGSMYRQCPKSTLAYGVMAGAFLTVTVFHWDVLLVILLCGLTGLVSSLLRERRKP